GHADPQVVDDPAVPAQVVVMTGLGAVAVRVEQEGAVVVLAVLWTRPGLSVIRVACVDAGLPEVAYPVVVGRHESDVEPARYRVLIVGGRQPEVLPLAERARSVALVDAKGLEHGVVEALRGHPVGDAYRDVVEHESDNLRA